MVNSDDPAAPEDGGGSSSQSPQSQSTSNNPTSMIEPKKMLTGLLGLKDDASDEDIQTAHDAHMNVKDAKDKLEKAHDKLSKAYDKHDKALQDLQQANTAANAERDTAKADAEKFRKLAVNARLDAALNSGRITAAERPEFETAFNADFDAAAASLGKKKAALNTNPLGLQPNADDLSTPALRQYAYNCLADELKRTLKLVTEDEVAVAMRSNAKGKAILAAMEAASKKAA